MATSTPHETEKPDALSAHHNNEEHIFFSLFFVFSFFFLAYYKIIDVKTPIVLIQNHGQAITATTPRPDHSQRSWVMANTSEKRRLLKVFQILCHIMLIVYASGFASLCSTDIHGSGTSVSQEQ